MRGTLHNRTFKIALIIMAVLIGIIDAKSVDRESYMPSIEVYSSDIASVSVSSLNGILEKNSFSYNDTLALVCPEDIFSYTDINSCEALISSGLNIEDPNQIIASLSWQMTGATEGNSPTTGINQINDYTFNEGTTVITYNGTTLYNNSVSCTFTVTVVDNQVPRLVNFSNSIFVAAATGDCGAEVSWPEPVVVDNCAKSGEIIVTGSHTSGSWFPVGETAITFHFDDGNGDNDADYHVTVNVMDNEIPAVSPPGRVTVAYGNPVPEAFVTLQEFINAGGTASDNCQIDEGSFRFLKETRTSVTSPFTITRTYLIEDENGNVAEVDHHIRVESDDAGLKSAATDISAAQSGNWNDPSTWVGGVVPNSGDNVTIPSGITVTVNSSTPLAVCHDIQIEGSLAINGSYTLQVSGSWTNSGSFNAGTDGTVEFTGTSNESISGTTTFENLIISKGSLLNTLTINGNTTVSSGGGLTLNSGLVTIASGGSLSLDYSAGLTIPITAGFDVTGGTLSTGNFSITNNGLIRVSSGTANFGVNSGNTVHTQNNGAFIVSGGSVNIAGRLESTAGGTLSPLGVNSGITIEGGIVTLSTAGNNLSGVGSLNVTSSGDFYFTGGTIVFQNPSTASTELDLGLIDGSGTKTTTGGTFQFGNASTPANSDFNIFSEIVLDNVTSTSNADLVLIGDIQVNNLALNSATSIDLNGFVLRQTVSGSVTTYSYPIEDSNGNLVSVTITLNSGTLGANPYFEVTTTDSKHPNNASTSYYLNQYWTITVNDITSPNYDVSADYQNTDIQGIESEIAAGVWNSSLPWIKGNTASGNTISATGITESTIDFTGITLDAPIVTINGGAANETICSGSSVTLTAVPTGDPGWTYSWTSNPSGFTASSASVTISPTANTNYSVEVTDGNGFTATDEIDVIVNPLPTATISGNATICDDGSTTEISVALTGSQPWSVTYQRDGGSDVTQSGITSSPYTFNVSAAGVYTVSVVSDVNCTGTSSGSATVDYFTNPTASISGDATICDDGSTTEISVVLTGTQPWSITYQRDGGNDVTQSGITTSPYTFNVSTAGVYMISAVNDANCSGTISGSTTVDYYTNPTATISGDATICDDGSTTTISVALTGSQPWSLTYQLDGGSDVTQSGITTSPYTFDASDAGVYTVSAVSDVNCSGTTSGSATVDYYTKPTMTSSNTDTICSGEEVNLTLISDIPSTFTWVAASDNSEVSGESLNEQTGSTITDDLTISVSSYDVQTITYYVIPTSNVGSCVGDTQTVTITVNPIISPYVQITTGSATICEGELVSFTSVVDDTSTYNASYQWKINGTPVSGANGKTFSSSSIQNGDKVTLDVWTPSAPCFDTASAFGYTMTVNPTVVPHIDITESDNEICAETTVSFISTPYNEGANPDYQWQISNNNIDWTDYAGADSSAFSIDTLTSGPRYFRVLLTSSAQCASPVDTVSESIEINVNPVLDPSVTITSNPDTAVCPGTTIQFSASPVNGGTNPQYQWKLNGNNVGTNLPTYSSAALVSGDQVWVVMTSNIDCPINNPVNSDTIIAPIKPGTPGIPGTIDGDIQVCPDDTLMYAIASVTDATSYSWSVSGTNWNIVSGNGNDTVYIAAGDPGSSAIISVTAENDCGTSAAQSLAVSVYTLSVPVTGINVTNNNTCYGTAKTLTVNGGSLGTGATWNWFTDGCGTTPAGSGPSITVDPLAGETITYYVRAEGFCNITACDSVDVIVNPATPSVPGAITGNTPVCPGETEIYYITSVEDANSYAWSVPGGWTIVSGQGDTLITVTTGAAGQNGNISVTAKNYCGTSVASTLSVTVDPGQPDDPGPISGTEELCAGSSDTYSITSLTNATKYNWGVPGDWTINGLDTTNSITVTAGATDGYIWVYAENSCGETDTSWVWVTLENTQALSPPDSVDGLLAICPALSTIYTVDSVTGADGYFWTVPAGWNIDGGQGTQTLEVTIPVGVADVGNVTVAAYNICDTSEAYSLEVSVDNDATVYAGPDQYVCEDIMQVYLAGQIGGAIQDKQDWEWESVNYPETNQIHYIDNHDALNSLFTFHWNEDPEGPIDNVGPGDSILIAIHATKNVGGCGYVSDTMVIYILPDPVATITTDTVCEGESATLTITATPNTKVTYIIDIEDQGTVDVGETGIATIVTGPLTENTTYDLIRIGYQSGIYGTETCTQSISGKAVVVVNYLPLIDAGDDQVICSNNPEILLNGSVTGSDTTGVWSGGSGTFLTDSTDLTGTYIPTQAEIDAGFLSLILTSGDPDGPCGTVSDQVDFTFDQAPLVNAGLDDTICSSSTALLAGSFGGSATSATWSTSGDGTFDDNTKTTAVYTPGVADSTAGWVYLIYTTNNPGTSCGALSDTMTLTINPAAWVDAGESQIICASSTVMLDGSIGGATTSATWSGGTGTFSDITDLLAEYTPSASEIASGSVTLTLTSDDPVGPCGTVSDQIMITINPLVEVDAGINQRICYGSSIVLEGSISGALSTGAWSGGNGTFSPNSSALNATYIPALGESDTTILLILTSDDPGTSCSALSDTMELRIDPVPFIYAGPDTMICEDDTIQLQGINEPAYGGTWTTDGTGYFIPNDSLPTANYVPGNGDVFNETVTILYTTKRPSGECGLVSDTMILTVKERIEITTQPVNTGVCALHVTDLFVNAVGDNLTFQWYKVASPDIALTNNSLITGVNTSTLHFNSATSADAGDYYVEINSDVACGASVSDTVSLNVDQEIEIITPLLSDTICIGDDITFSIVAEPGGELNFQWLKDNIDITDSTRNELEIHNATLADAGSYTVFITGMEGYTCDSTTSAPGILVVMEDVTITPVDVDRTFCLNSTDVNVKYNIDGGADNVTVPAGDLPPGLTGSFNADSMEFVISGTPTMAGVYPFTVSTSGFCVQDMYEDTIIINPELVAPQITIDNPDICYNYVPDSVYMVTLPLGGSEPYTYEWQDSTSGGTWVSTGDIGTSINPPALIDTTYYRVITTDVGDPSCGSIISNVIAIYPFDNTLPTFDVPSDKTRKADANCTAFVGPLSTGSPDNLDDNCTDVADLDVSYFDHDTTDVGCNFSFMRTWQVMDEAGNIALDTQLITIADSTPPVIANRPANVIIDCGISRHPDNLGWASFDDNCDDNVTVSYYDVVVAGTCAGDSTVSRYWIGTDNCGNVDTASTATVITISDITPPLVYDEKDTILACVGDLPQAWQIPNFGIEDACGGYTVELVDEYAWGIDDVSGYCPYKVDRTWEVTDDCNNSIQFVQSIVITQGDTCPACKECLYDNTYNWADLTGNADSSITFYDVVKRDKCCGAENQPGGDNLYCASFNIKIDPYAIGVEILVDHVTPPGQDWQVDCEEVDGGKVVCLEPGRFHLFTFCKHAESEEPQENDYTFRSISGLLEGGDIETREECDKILEVDGTFDNITWNSVYPGAVGDYNHLLSGESDTLKYFNAEIGSPPHIQYQVCGQLSQSLCFTDAEGWVCDTIDVYVHEAISLDLNVNPDLICEDSVPTITPTIYPAGVYDLDWYSGQNATGTWLGSETSFTPLGNGWYSVIVTDNATGLGCNTDTINFEMKYDYTGPTIKNTPPTLFLECNDPNYDDIIYNWLESPSAEYINADGDTVSTPVNYDYYSTSGPVTMICGDSVRVQFTAMDQCSNDTIEYAYIVVIDTTKPVLTPAIDSTIQCSTTDPGQDPGFLAWIANHGGATASDVCDPVLTWSVDTAFTDWTWDPADNERTVTFYVTDACGNVDSTTATFSVIDTVAPVLYCPGDFEDTIGPDSCSITTLNLDTVWAEDDCSVPELNWTIVRPDGTSYSGMGQVNNETFNVGISYVYYEAIDDAGLVDTCSFTVWVKHLEIDPIAYNCPNEDTVKAYADAVDCNAYVDLDTVSIYDPCDEIDSVWNNSPADGATPTNADGYYEVGVTTFYWYIHTTSQTLDSCEVNVYVIDTTKPIFIECPIDAVDSLTNNDCDLVSDQVEDPVIGGDCSPLSLTYELILPDNSTYADSGFATDYPFPVGTTQVFYILADTFGNEVYCDFTVTIKKDLDEGYDFDCPDPGPHEAWADASCLAYVSLDTLTVTDTCNAIDSIWHNSPALNTTPGDASGDYEIGITTFHWFVRNYAGITDSCEVNVIVYDTLTPSFSFCPPSVEDSLLNEDCDLVSALVQDPVISGDCSPLSLTYELLLPDSTTYLDSGFASGYPFPVGTTHVYYTLADTAGNEDYCDFTVTVKKDLDEGYDYTCPAPGPFEEYADSITCVAFVALDSLVVTDTCDAIDSVWHDSPAIGVTATNASGDYPIGVTTFHWYVRNYANTVETCEVTVIVYDTISPYFTYCPPDVEDSIVTEDCYKIPDNIQDPEFSGDCSPLSLTYELYHEGSFLAADSGFASSYPFPVGKTQVYYTLADSAGNVDYCDFQVWIKQPNVPEGLYQCPQPLWEVDAARDSCEAYLSLDTLAILTNVCDALDSIWHNSPYGTDSMDASGFYPIGTTTFHWFISDLSGNVDSCQVDVIVNDYLPELECPDDIIIPADYNDTVATGVTIDPPTFHDNCPDSTLTWRTWGATILTYGDTATNGINILSGPETFNVDTTWIEYKFTDQHLHTVICTFIVVVEAAPVIECPPSDTFYADNNCEYLFYPGEAELISGAQPVWWTWTLTNPDGTILSGLDTTYAGDNFPDPIVSNAPNEYPFQLGTTNITWTAENLAGADTCWHEILVIDTTPPVIYELDSLEDCMEVIQYAIYSADEQDLYYPDRPDYIVLEQGDTTLNLTVIDEYEDNCELNCADSITWVIDFSDYTDQNGVYHAPQDSVYWGSGQISEYPTDMQFPGDGTYMGNVEHWVSYYATDCAGNTSMVGQRKIVVTPRPKIVKENFY